MECRDCPHPFEKHDREGCTATIPCEDPDFGPTQTCPCCQRNLTVTIKPQERLNGMSDDELRLRVETLLEQIDKEDTEWPKLRRGGPGAYLYTSEIRFLLGLGPGPSYRALEEAIERDRA